MRRAFSVPTFGLVLLAAACGGAGDPPTADPATAPPVAAAVPSADTRDLAAYPQAYRTMDLPALPGGVVTSTGRQTTSLRDGLVIQLTTDMSVAEARDYYRNALASRGWTEETGPGQAASAMLPDLPLARLSFTLDPLAYAVTLTASDGPTQVRITLIER